MALGLSPKYTATYELNGLSQQQFLVLAVEAAIRCRWSFGHISPGGLLANTNHGTYDWNATILVQAKGDTATVTSTSAGRELTDWGKNRKNIAGFLAVIEQLRTRVSGEEMDARYEQMLAYNQLGDDAYLHLKKPTVRANAASVLDAFIPTKDYFVTPLMVNINILIFIAMAATGVNIMMPDHASLLHWGANFRPLTLAGEWWRLLTNCFLHIGLVHLLMNMYALVFIGLLLEPHLGRLRFLSAYVLTGIAGSVVSLWWHDTSTISAGASGAIFGMYGVYLAMLTTNHIEQRQRKAQLASIIFFVGYNLLVGIQGSIDNAAHTGGLVSGLLIGYAFMPGLKRPQNKAYSYASVAIAAIIILGAAYGVLNKLPKDMVQYENQMQTFAAIERKALSPFDLPGDTPKQQRLEAFRDSGIHYWREGKQVIASMANMDLPGAVVLRNKKLLHYCELRIRSYEAMTSYIAQGDSASGRKVDELSQQIKLVLDDLAGKTPVMQPPGE